MQLPDCQPMLPHTKMKGPSPAKSAAMARVRSRDTGPELIVRSVLHRAGFRFTTHVGALPGTPDIVLPRHRLAIFVHGCFWHGHDGCARASVPKTRTAFWASKIARNIERDHATITAFAQIDWRTLVIWTCETRSADVLVSRLREALDLCRPINVPDRLNVLQPRKSRSSPT
jgi:DNA mismatch endonuclease (patch repair protein)